MPYGARHLGTHCLDKWFIAGSALISPQNQCSVIITLVRHKKALFDTNMSRSTHKCVVRHQHAQFDTKCHTQHASVAIVIIKHPHPPSFEKCFFFSVLFKYFVLKNPWRNEKCNYIDIQIYLISLWNMKCNYSFLFVMIILSAAINKCYWYDSIILPTSAFSFD